MFYSNLRIMMHTRGCSKIENFSCLYESCDRIIPTGLGVLLLSPACSYVYLPSLLPRTSWNPSPQTKSSYMQDGDCLLRAKIEVSIRHRIWATKESTRTLLCTRHAPGVNLQSLDILFAAPFDTVFRPHHLLHVRLHHVQVTDLQS